MKKVQAATRTTRKVLSDVFIMSVTKNPCGVQKYTIPQERPNSIRLFFKRGKTIKINPAPKKCTYKGSDALDQRIILIVNPPAPGRSSIRSVPWYKQKITTCFQHDKYADILARVFKHCAEIGYFFLSNDLSGYEFF